ncbi:hypothetical protein diail_5930 [Diaporthe ilicicola]|nr:hypothetical protein diail_5930 [Diaporthe ilicicola]
MSTSKSILVTGCSAEGIGAALALVLAQKGHHVFVTARNVDKVPVTLKDLENVTVLTLDVTDTTSITAAARAVKESGRGLDVLVNNAGVGYVLPVLDVDINAAQRLFDVNLWGPLRMIQVFADLLIASRGRIVNISSSASVVNSPWVATYAASKAALNMLSETLRLEISPFGVSVVTILPGVIDSNLHINDSKRSDMPPTSRYLAIKKTIAEWACGEALPKDGLPADQFAELVINDVLGIKNPKGGLLSRGPYAALLRRIGTWAPTWMADYVVRQNQGLNELGKEA